MTMRVLLIGERLVDAELDTRPDTFVTSITATG